MGLPGVMHYCTTPGFKLCGLGGIQCAEVLDTFLYPESETPYNFSIEPDQLYQVD